MLVSCFSESDHVLRFRNPMSAFTLSWKPISIEIAMARFHRMTHNFCAQVRTGGDDETRGSAMERVDTAQPHALPGSKGGKSTFVIGRRTFRPPTGSITKITKSLQTTH
jgi:hypothetical protein